MQERVFNTPNIEVLFEHNTKELYGTDMGLERHKWRRHLLQDL